MLGGPSKYFSDPKGDLFLLSSDNHAFTVHKVVIAMASETFGAMLESGVQQPRGEEDGTLSRPLVVDAPAEVLDIVFRLIYPGGDTSVDLSRRVDLIYPVAAFAQKYLLDGLLGMLKRDFTRLTLQKPSPIGGGWDREVGPVIPAVSPSIIEQDPLRAYAIAVLLEWMDVLDLIQVFCYRLDMLRGACKLSQEWDLLRPCQYHDLVAHYHRVRESALKLANDFMEGAPRLEEEILCEEGLTTVEVPWYHLEHCICNDPRSSSGLPKRRRDKKTRTHETSPPPYELSPSTSFKVPHWVKVLHRYIKEEILERAAKPPPRFISSPESKVQYTIEQEVSPRCWNCAKHMEQHWRRVIKLESSLDQLV